MARRGFVGLVAAVSPDLVIAMDGFTPWRYPADLARFKRLTVGTTVIMGRGTFESIRAIPLADRINFVVTRATYDHVRTFRTVPDAIAAARGEVWIIGGERIYAAALPYADRIDLTHVPDVVTGGVLAHFPRFDPTRWIASARTRLPDDELLEVQTFTRRPS